MTYRIFRYNGQVTDRIDRYGEGASLSSDEVAAAEVALALAVAVSAVAVEHLDIVPAVEVVIPPAVDANAQAQKATLDALAAPLVKAVEDVLLARQMAPMTPPERAAVSDGAVYLASRGQFGKPA